MSNDGKFIQPTALPIIGISFLDPQTGYISSDRQYTPPKLAPLNKINYITGVNSLPDNGIYRQQERPTEETEVSIITRSHSGQFGAIKNLLLVEEMPLADKTLLGNLINQIISEDLQESTYSSESWAVFIAAFIHGQAVYADEDVTQQQVDDAYEDLLFGYNYLETPNETYIDGLVQIGSTPYYKLPETTAYSQGPGVYGTPPIIDDLAQYKAHWDPQTLNIVVSQENEGEYTSIFSVVEPIEPYHLSFTFDQNGGPAVSWEINGSIKLYYFDIVSNGFQTVTIATGKSPFIAMSSFNNVISINRQIYLLYVRPDNTLCYRAQNDRYTIEYPIVNNVIDILAVGQTSFNNLKVEFVRDLGNDEYEIQNIATERDGYWVGERLTSEFTITDISFDLRPYQSKPNDLVENPFIMDREVFDIAISTEEIASVAEHTGTTEEPFEMTRVIEDIVIVIEDQVNKIEPEEPVPEPLVLTADLLSMNILYPRQDIFQEEPVPNGLIHTASLVSLTITE